MTLNTDLTAHLGLVLAVVSLAWRVPRVAAFPLRKRLAGLAVGMLLLSLPVGGVSLLGMVRGFTGDLSLTSLVLLALPLLAATPRPLQVETHNRYAALKALALLAAVFYPMALGLGMFDPYRLGYGEMWFIIVLQALAIWAALSYSTLLAWLLAIAVAAWSMGWYESTNLWDYLIDPWLAIYALSVVIKREVYLRWKRRAHV